MKTKFVAVILCFFLGWLWIHKFYLWQYWMWFLYLLFSWTLMPAFIAFIEMFFIAFMKQEEFDDRYNLDYILKKKQLENLNLNK